MELGIIIVLGTLLVFQHVFYSYQMHKFTNKIMSGTYTAYVQTEELKKQNQMSGFSMPLPQDEGPSELEQLNRLLSPPF